MDSTFAHTAMTLTALVGLVACNQVFSLDDRPARMGGGSGDCEVPGQDGNAELDATYLIVVNIPNEPNLGESGGDTPLFYRGDFSTSAGMLSVANLVMMAWDRESVAEASVVPAAAPVEVASDGTFELRVGSNEDPITMACEGNVYFCKQRGMRFTLSGQLCANKTPCGGVSGVFEKGQCRTYNIFDFGTFTLVPESDYSAPPYDCVGNLSKSITSGNPPGTPSCSEGISTCVNMPCGI